MPIEMFFYRAAEARHAVALEVREDDEIIVVLEMRADDVFFQMLAVLHGQARRAVRVHDVEVGYARVAVSACDAHVVVGRLARAAVGHVALDEVRVERLHEVFNKVRREEVVAALLARAYLHGDVLALCLAFERSVGLHQSRGADVLRKVDLRDGCLGSGCGERGA